MKKRSYNLKNIHNKKKNVKKKFVSLTMLGLIIGGSGMQVGTSIVSADSINAFPNAVTSSSIKEIPNDYSFIAKWIKGKSESVPFGDGWYETHETTGGAKTNSWTVQSPSDDKKGKIGILYKNVGTYKGQNVNLKVTVKDWKKYLNNDTAKISLIKNSIGLDITGYEDVLVDWEYVDDSGKSMDIKGSYMTFNDLDAYQFIGFDKDTASKIKQIVYNDDSILQYQNVSGVEVVKASDDGANYDNADKRTMFTALYEGSKISFHFGVDPAHRNHDKVYPKDQGGEEHMGYTAKKLARTELIDPVKKVSDTDENRVDSNTLVNENEEFSYDIFHQVPDEYKEYYYKSYTISDSVADILEIKDVKVFDEGDNDISDKFDIDYKDNKLNVKAKETGKAEFYNHTYRVNVKTSIKEGADLSKYIVDGKVSIPNKAKVEVDGTAKDSNEVNTTFTEIEAKVNKALVDNGSMVEHEDLSEENQIATFRLDNIVPNKHIKSLTIEDDLEDVFEVENKDDIKVYASDVTAEDNKQDENKEEQVEAQVDEEDSKEESTESEDQTTTEDSKDDSTESEVKEDSELTGDAVNIGEDVTSEGDLEVKDNKIIWKAKDPSKFAGKKLSLVFQAKVKDGVDLSKYEKDGVINIPNKSKLVVDGKTTESNEVTVTPKPKEIKPVVEKSLVDDGKEVEHENLNKEDNVATYKLENTIPNKDVSSLTIKDTLEDVLEIVNKEDMKVYMSELEKEDNNESEATTEKVEEDVQTDEKASKATKKAKDVNQTDLDSLEKEVNDLLSKYESNKDDKSPKSVVYNWAHTISGDIEGMKQGTDKTKFLNSAKDSIKQALESKTFDKESSAYDEEAKNDLVKLQEVVDKLLEISTGKVAEDTATKDEAITESEETSKDNSETVNDEADKELSELGNLGEDVTSEGDLTIDGNTVTWTAKDPSKFKGKKLTLVLQAKVKEGADTSKYEVDGKVDIPNTSQLILEDETIDSNEVNVTPEKEETPAPPKVEEPSSSSEAPKEQAPQSTEQVEKKDYNAPLPQTGTDKMKQYGIISAVIGGVSALGYGIYRFLKNKSGNNK